MPNELEQSRGVQHPLVLINAMIEKGTDPEALKKMMDLAERWRANEAREAYQLAMNGCQQRLPAVIKDKPGANKGLYAQLETIQYAARPVIMEHGFSLSWSIDPTYTREGWQRLVCYVAHTGGHVEKHFGEYPLDGTGAKGGAVMNALQGTVSSHTYAQRDMLRMIFNVVLAGHDSDGNGARIGPDQIGEINDLLAECEANGQPVNFKKFLEWLGIGSLEELTFGGFAKAIHELNRKRKQTGNSKAKA